MRLELSNNTRFHFVEARKSLTEEYQPSHLRRNYEQTLSNFFSALLFDINSRFIEIYSTYVCIKSPKLIVKRSLTE